MTPRAASRETGDAVLLTGVTGFVGMEVLARYLERSDRRVVTLIRAADEQAARARLDSVLNNLFGVRGRRYAKRVDAVPADLLAPGLGISAARRATLARRISTIIHSAASVSFTLPLEEARAVNVGGTRQMLELAEMASTHGGLHRYAQVSTAYVAGTHAGSFGERNLDVGQSFHNSYEQSKFESEQLVHAQDGLPYSVMRPSIVVAFAPAVRWNVSPTPSRDSHSAWIASAT